MTRRFRREPRPEKPGSFCSIASVVLAAAALGVVTQTEYAGMVFVPIVVAGVLAGVASLMHEGGKGALGVFANVLVLWFVFAYFVPSQQASGVRRSLVWLDGMGW